MTYGSRALGTRLRATFRSSGGHFPASKPKAIPIRLSTSMSSWISNMLSKLNKYSNLETERHEGLFKINLAGCMNINTIGEAHAYIIWTATQTLILQDLSFDRFWKDRPVSSERNAIKYLSLEMLQSMTVFLLVLTMMKGRWMMELAGGGLFACCSPCLFRWTRFLKAICCRARSREGKINKWGGRKPFHNCSRRNFLMKTLFCLRVLGSVFVQEFQKSQFRLTVARFFHEYRQKCQTWNTNKTNWQKKHIYRQLLNKMPVGSMQQDASVSLAYRVAQQDVH